MTVLALVVAGGGVRRPPGLARPRVRRAGGRASRSSTSGRARRCAAWRSGSRAAARRRLLGARRAVLRRHAAVDRRRTSATTCCTRCSTSPPRSTRGSTSRTGSGRSSWPRRTRAAPGGRTWRSRCSRRGSAPTRRGGTTCRTSGSSTTGGWATTARRASGSRRRRDVPGAPWWLRSLAAVTLAQGGDRQSSRRLWQAHARDAPTTTGCGTTPTLRLAQLDALDAIDQLTAAGRRVQGADGRVPGVVGRAGARAADPRRAARPERRRRSCSTRRRASVTLSPESPLNPLPGRLAGGPAPGAERR